MGDAVAASRPVRTCRRTHQERYVPKFQRPRRVTEGTARRVPAAGGRSMMLVAYLLAGTVVLLIGTVLIAIAKANRDVEIDLTLIRL